MVRLVGHVLRGHLGLEEGRGGGQGGLTWLSSHGWSCNRRAQSVSGVTRAYLKRFWMAEVVQMYL